jgi:hypothetical protein
MYDILSARVRECVCASVFASVCIRVCGGACACACVCSITMQLVMGDNSSVHICMLYFREDLLTLGVTSL